MAGIRKKPLANGKYQGWFMDYRGRQKFFTGTTNQRETMRIAERLEDEHQQIKLGYREPPKEINKNRSRFFDEVAKEYLDWGNSQGGRGGKAWGSVHARNKKGQLKWWEKKMKLETLADLDGILPKVEAALRDIQKKGRTGRTIMMYAETLRSFCRWCVNRDYLEKNPLKRLQPYDMTPRTIKRAMTLDELQKLLNVAPPERRILYEVACTTGLRAKELASLKVKDLNHDLKALELRSEWTKNRKSGVQPLPEWVCEGLKASTVGKKPDDPLVYLPSHPSREMDKDLEAAGIPKVTAEGKLDFHALRTAYVTFLLESGATVKEAQALARHSNPELTMNVYGRTRAGRLVEVTEKVGNFVNFTEKYAKYMHLDSGKFGINEEKPSENADLAHALGNGGGGSRTRVRRGSANGDYVRSPCFNFPAVSHEQDTPGGCPL